MTPQELSYYLKKADRVIPFDLINKEPVELEDISRYYTDAGFLYRRFHSKEGAMHFPVKISEEERHVEKLQFQARFVESIIRKYNLTTVTEMGSGTGYNLRYLAAQFPNVQFVGLDLTDSNIQLSRRLSANYPNLRFRNFNFDIENDHQYKTDLVFGVETFCYSKNFDGLIAGISRCLNPNGKLVIFDGYINNDVAEPISTEDEAKAYKWVCWGYAIQQFQDLKLLVSTLDKHGLKIDSKEDYSTHILPNYDAYLRGSTKSLKFNLLLKVLLKLGILPLAYFKQIMAGFGPYLIRKGFLGYYQLVISKK